MVTATPASIILAQTETTCLSGHFCIIVLNLVSNLESKGGARVTGCHRSRSHSICFFTLITQAHKKKICLFCDGDYTFLLYFFPLNPNPTLKVGGWLHILNITSKNCRKAVFLWKNLRRKKNIVSITFTTLSFYVFWLAELEFVMEKEI